MNLLFGINTLKRKKKPLCIFTDAPQWSKLPNQLKLIVLRFKWSLEPGYSDYCGESEEF